MRNEHNNNNDKKLLIIDNFSNKKTAMLRSQHVLANNQIVDCEDDLEIPEEFDTSNHITTNPIENNGRSLIKNIQQCNTKRSASKEGKKKKLTLGLQSFKDIKSAYLRTKSKNANDNQMKPEDKECTFTPKINSHKKLKPRKFDDFISQQESFLKNKNTKIENIKTQMTDREEENYTGTPKIDYRSRKISE